MIDRLRNISRHRLVAIYVSAIVTHLLSIIAFYLLSRSVGVDLPIVFIGWIRSTMILSKMIPISVSGLGLREGTTLYILSAYGSPTEIALAFSLLVFVVSDLIPAFIGGILELRG